MRYSIPCQSNLYVARSHRMVSLYQQLFARSKLLPHPRQPSSPNSRIHIIILPILLLLLLFLRRRSRRILFPQQILSIQRTCRMELQPRLYAFEIENVGFVTGKADDERVLVYGFGKLATGSSSTGGEGGTCDRGASYRRGKGCCRSDRRRWV